MISMVEGGNRGRRGEIAQAANHRRGDRAETSRMGSYASHVAVRLRNVGTCEAREQGRRELTRDRNKEPKRRIIAIVSSRERMVGSKSDSNGGVD